MLIQALLWYGLAVVMAALEVESEGKFGWADNAPTWYRTTGPAARLYGAIMSGKPLTGYHAFMFCLPLFIFHLPFVMPFMMNVGHEEQLVAGIPWTLTNEALALAAYFVVCPYWDFLWFVLNPHYGISNFHKSFIWWHNKSIWIWRIPMDYIMGVAISIGFAYLASYLANEPTIFAQHMVVVGLLVALVPITALVVAPAYQTWYWWMRRKDDRDKVKRFYKQ